MHTSDCEKTLSSIYSSRSSSICSNVSSRRDSLNVKKDGTFYRTMWKKLAMDLSRKNCKINYASSKLMYDEMPIMDSEASATKELVATWEHILNSGQGVDKREIQSAVKNGIDCEFWE
uniref:Uncharacterized protein n=1 Tax=Romanomermis culicivorax TaxID=13658 RepID=A0A915ILF6_ROMCU